MTTTVFDTLKASRNLKVADAQAEAIVTSMAEAFDDAVATKAGISEVEAELKSMATKADIAVILANATMTIAWIRFLP